MPAYLTDECTVHFTSKPTDLVLDERASSALKAYLSENAPDVKQPSGVVVIQQCPT